MSTSEQWIPRLRGIVSNIFNIGGMSGIAIKNSSGVMNVRNGDDTGHADMSARHIRIHGNNTTHSVILQAPNGMAANVNYTLPATQGSTNEFLSTDGAGGLIWASPSDATTVTVWRNFSEATATVSIITPPANAILERTRIIVDVAAGSGGPSIIIGISTETNKYIALNEVNLRRAGQYIFDLGVDVGASPSPIIATISASGQSFSGRIGMSYSVA